MLIFLPVVFPSGRIFEPEKAAVAGLLGGPVAGGLSSGGKLDGGGGGTGPSLGGGG